MKTKFFANMQSRSAIQHSRTILVIEDERSLRENLAEMLGFEGFEVFSAANGREGIDLATSILPDLILCDIMMPVLDGYAVLENLRQKDETRFIPFIFLTAIDDRHDVRTAMSLGADDFISKPFDISEVLEAIHKRLEMANWSRASSEERLNELRRNILNHVPHEVLTPLNGIIGFSELLRDTPQNFSQEEISQMAKAIQESGKRLHTLMEKYLFYIRLEAATPGKPFLLSDKSTADLLHEIVLDYPIGIEREMDFQYEIHPFSIQMRERDFRFVIREILHNAFRYSCPGERVSLTVVPFRDVVEIQIADQGMGFPDGSIKKIGAFWQYNREKIEQQGSGLSLAIVQKLCLIHEGTFTGSNNPDKGCTVTLRFPVLP